MTTTNVNRLEQTLCVTRPDELRMDSRAAHNIRLNEIKKEGVCSVIKVWCFYQAFSVNEQWCN